MAIKPMLFNTEMVRAILSGQKTCTRRVIKGRALDNLLVDHDGNCVGSFDYFGAEVEYPTIDDCSYQPGDILYVRETWSTDADGGYVYRTNYGTTKDDSFPPSMFKWRPSIHMPKEAARIFLRVTDVRVERLQEIDGAGIKAEGTSGKHGFSALWDSTIKPTDLDRYGWAANPWVWVIEFERISSERHAARKEVALGGDGDA